jgi:hypothetical protein
VRNAYIIFVEIPIGREHLGDLGVHGDIIKMDPNEIGYGLN